jgi:quercetin dioxygenase-like cupin family protein
LSGCIPYESGSSDEETAMSEPKDLRAVATHAPSAIPDDDPQRQLTIARPENDDGAIHIGLVGDTYTLLLTGKETAGRFCLIDMHIPPGGGPPPHRHDFEETFSLLDGELEATFRGKKSVVRAGETIHIPANAPHQFHNASLQPVRLLCLCSPAGQEDLFLEVGTRVATRTTPPPPLDAAAQAEFMAKIEALAPKYRTQMLDHA